MQNLCVEVIVGLCMELGRVNSVASRYKPQVSGETADVKTT